MKKPKLMLVGLIVGLIFTQMAVTSSSDSSYDPWLDLNDDGKIDVNDLQALAWIYGTSGEPINKTELLLHLKSRVEALETRTPKKGYFSLHATAFGPHTHELEWIADDLGLMGGDPNGGSAHFYGAVHLPNGCRVTNMTVVLFDATTLRRVSVSLGRFYTWPGAIGWESMASIWTTNDFSDPDPQVLFDDTIMREEINNEEYSYVVQVQLNGAMTTGPIALEWVLLEYEYPA